MHSVIVCLWFTMHEFQLDLDIKRKGWEHAQPTLSRELTQRSLNDFLEMRFEQLESCDLVLIFQASLAPLECLHRSDTFETLSTKHLFALSWVGQDLVPCLHWKGSGFSTDKICHILLNLTSGTLKGLHL